jgi:hypothetical protein
MTVIVAGHRRSGRVHAHGGEYADTEFAHLYYVPIVPLGSFWVTNEPGGSEHSGFPIKLHWRSVGATYLRVWAPVLSTFLLLAPSLVANAGAAALAALSAWSWTWRSRRGAHARRRSDFDRIALGSRCDPAWMTDDMRGNLSRKLAAQLAARPDARPPDDVARFGARDLDEAILAYGVLRVAGVDHSDARAAADQLLVSAMGEPAHGGPYREPGEAGAPRLGAEISAIAQRHAAATEARMRAVPPRWFHDRRIQLAALVGLTALLGFEVHAHVPVGADPIVLGTDQAPVGRWVVVRCDRVDDRGWEVLEGSEVKERVAFCRLGIQILPVVSDEDDPIDGSTLEGRLRELRSPTPRARAWIAQLRADADLNMFAYPVYLRRFGETDRRFALLAIAATAAGVLAGWPLWIRALLRRRRARAA